MEFLGDPPARVAGEPVGRPTLGDLRAMWWGVVGVDGAPDNFWKRRKSRRTEVDGMRRWTSMRDPTAHNLDSDVDTSREDVLNRL